MPDKAAILVQNAPKSRRNACRKKTLRVSVVIFTGSRLHVDDSPVKHFLLNDIVNAYEFDSANRLISFSGQGVDATFVSNGLGNRIQETVNGNTTTVIMDFNTGLTQALSDGTNDYIYGVHRIAQVNTGTEYFLGDALGSVRQLTNQSGAITYARAYDPYGVVTTTSGSSQSAYGYTGEFYDSYIKLIYLRSRMYSPETGRFTTKDSWQGDYNRPLSLNRWMYTEGNPINFTDPSGQSGMGPWCQNNFSSRADAAEKYVARSAFGDYLNTYTAAGIGVQCWGTNWNRSLHYSGEGIAQITDKQAEIEWSKPIYEYDIFGNQKYRREGILNLKIKLDKNGNLIPIIRGYGLRRPCPDGELEDILDQNIDENAVILMKRQIQLVTDACVGCTPTDIYIAAALAQNGPGFNLQNMTDLTRTGTRINKPMIWGEWLQVDKKDVTVNWDGYFRNPGNADDTQRHLKLFDGVIQELRKRNWYIPDVKWPVVDYLKTIGD